MFYESAKYEEAIQCLNKALKIEPNLTKALLIKGHCLYELTKYEESIVYFDKVLKIDPRNINALIGKGDSFHGLKRYNKASGWYNKVRQIDRSNPEAIVKITLNKMAAGTDKFGKQAIKTKVFINSIREDGEYGERLVTELKNSRLYLEPQVWSIQPHYYLEEVINESRYFISLISSRVVENRYIGFEWTLKLLKQTQQTKKIIVIPVRLDDCKIPYSQLEKIQFIDLFPDWNQGFEKLLEAIDGGDNFVE